ncbi:interference hedgehog isoform X1 [Schistocerca nitens]|uniref:interference hedgehog isoform X1 n=2 Tax=Schistocerca nitens TaxID=7011 RepID=UPI0021188F54|nr:interference hedgehog isoform X1 [Schistocerca nitens]
MAVSQVLWRLSAAPLLLAALTVVRAADMTQLFLRSPEDAVAPLGDRVSFDCRLRSGADRIRWKHAGRFVSHVPQQAQSTSASSHAQQSPHPAPSGANGGKGRVRSSYQVHVTSYDQAGDYQCVAWFGAAALVSTPAQLLVARLDPFPGGDGPSQQVEVHVAVGGSLVLPCQPPPSVPPPALLFYRDEHRLQPRSAAAQAGPGRLLLTSLSESDSGNYTCEAVNDITGQLVRSPRIFSVTVTRDPPRSAPRFLDDPVPLRRYPVRAGDNVTLPCWALGHPTPVTNWFREGNHKLHPTRSAMVPGGLMLTGTTLEDTGRYKCILENSLGSVSLEALVEVLEPPVLVRGPKVDRVQQGDNVVLECEFRGSPQPNITWVFNGNSVTNDSHITVIRGNLAIQNADLKHAGIFQCFGRNELGSVFGSAMVEVAPNAVSINPDDIGADGTDIGDGSAGGSSGKKSEGPHKGTKDRRKINHGHVRMIPPSRPHVTRLSDTSVMVRWKVTPNHGLPIQFFKVQYSHKGHGGSGGGGKHQNWMTNNGDIPPYIHTYEVDNLEPNQTYRFRIAAAYSNDDNKLSPNLRHFHLKSDVGIHLPAPTLYRTSALSPTSIKLYWKQSEPAELEGFYIYYRPASTAGDYLHVTVEDPQADTFDVEHLQPDTTYEVKLQGFVKEAASAFSAILTQKTLPLPVTEPPVSGADSTVDGANSAQVLVKTVEASGAGTLYLAVGCSVGVIVVVLVAATVVWLLYRRKVSARAGERGSDSRDKFPEITAVAKGGRGGGQQNGRPPQRLPQTQQPLANGKLTITTNPLAEAEDESLMEAARSQNNNCEGVDPATGASVPAGSTELACWRQQQQQQPQAPIPYSSSNLPPENYV